MVNIIENRALITGTVTFVSETPDPRGMHELKLQLKSSTDLDNLPNLARNDEGREITIRISKDGLHQSNIQKGSDVTLTARKAFGQIYFAHEARSFGKKDQTF